MTFRDIGALVALALLFLLLGFGPWRELPLALLAWVALWSATH